MKIILEPADIQETELTIKGNISSPEVESLLSFIKSNNIRGKLVLYKDEEQFFVDAKEVMYFESAYGKVSVHTENDSFQTKQKLYELMDSLKALPFAQISKSVIVNIDFVKSVSAEFSGNYSLRLKNSKEILTISRKFMKDFKSKI